MVVAIEQCDANRRVCQCARGVESTETAADDYDAR